MWVLFSKHTENPAPSMYQPTRASHLCVIFGQSTRNSSDRFDGKKGAVIPFCRFSTEGLEIAGTEAKGKVAPHKKDGIIPFRLAAFCLSLEAEHSQLYSGVHFQPSSGKATGSSSCDILHSPFEH